MRLRVSTLFILIFISYSVFQQQASAQQFGKLRGVVTDSSNGEALVYCNVYIQELKTGASTNERGLFIINSIPANKFYTIVVSYVGYDTKILSVQILPDKLKDLSIRLKP